MGLYGFIVVGQLPIPKTISPGTSTQLPLKNYSSANYPLGQLSFGHLLLNPITHIEQLLSLDYHWYRTRTITPRETYPDWRSMKL